MSSSPEAASSLPQPLPSPSYGTFLQTSFQKEGQYQTQIKICSSGGCKDDFLGIFLPPLPSSTPEATLDFQFKTEIQAQRSQFQKQYLI